MTQETIIALVVVKVLLVGIAIAIHIDKQWK